MSKPMTDKEIGLIRSGSRLSVQVCLVDRSLNPIQFSLHALLSLWSTLNSDNCCPLLRFEIRLIAEQKAREISHLRPENVSGTCQCEDEASILLSQSNL